jgi:hypothetical protein
MTRQKFLLAVFLLLSLPLFGQYSATAANYTADFLNSSYAPPVRGGSSGGNYNCAAKNCFQLLYGNGSQPAFTGITVSIDNEVQAVDGNGKRWRWDLPSQTWQEQTDSISFKAVYLGSLANDTYLAISTSGQPYTWSGAWQALGSQTCVTGAANASYYSNASLFCVDASGIPKYFQQGTWFPLGNGSSVAAITANNSNVLVVTTGHNVYSWDIQNPSGWTELASPGFTPAATAGAIGLGYDGTISILDTAGNVQVSHDGGSTFTAVYKGGMTVLSLAHSNATTTFVLASTGAVQHLNSMVTVGTMAITGSCGSACGSGNPSVQVSFGAAYYQGNNVQVGCPSGWTMEGNPPDPSCVLITTADTDLNTVPVIAFGSCDSFAPGNQPTCASEIFNVQIFLVVTGASLLSKSQDCQCTEELEGNVNQKYYVTSSNYNSAPSYFGLLGILGAYQWNPSTVQQWCMSTVYPNLQQSGGVRILYYSLPPKPSAMPGRYINGDVPSIINLTTGKIRPALIGAFWSAPAPTLISYSNPDKSPYGGDLGDEYTWNNTDTQLRGPGGEPTEPCQGTKLP